MWVTLSIPAILSFSDAANSSIVALLKFTPEMRSRLGREGDGQGQHDSATLRGRLTSAATFEKVPWVGVIGKELVDDAPACEAGCAEDEGVKATW